MIGPAGAARAAAVQLLRSQRIAGAASRIIHHQINRNMGTQHRQGSWREQVYDDADASTEAAWPRNMQARKLTWREGPHVQVLHGLHAPELQQEGRCFTSHCPLRRTYTPLQPV